MIAAVKDEEGLSLALKSDVEVVFTLYGNVVNIGHITQRIKESGKACMVHIDLVEGLSSREVSVEFIAQSTAAEGILTTKATLVKKAKECNLLAVQRFFLLDSMAVANIRRQNPKEYACAVEVLPGLMPTVIQKVVQSLSLPVIAGGLITSKEDVVNALSAGAFGVSTTNPEVWRM